MHNFFIIIMIFLLQNILKKPTYLFFKKIFNPRHNTVSLKTILKGHCIIDSRLTRNIIQYFKMHKKITLLVLYT
jgi:hypothetical protein